jgi:hypothetical protein
MLLQHFKLRAFHNADRKLFKALFMMISNDNVREKKSQRGESHLHQFRQQ